MVHAARASNASAPAPPSPIQSLAKHNRKPSQLAENNHQRPKSIASFSPLFCPCAAPRRSQLKHPPASNRNKFAHSGVGRPMPRVCRFTNHQSLLTNHAFLIATRQLLEINPTHSQQRRKHFLFDTNERFFPRLYRIESLHFPSRPSPDCSVSPPPADDPFAHQNSTCPTSAWRVRAPHVNIRVRLLLLDAPSGTVCTGIDQGCKDRARKPFLVATQ